jgi:hypothetical protein
MRVTNKEIYARRKLLETQLAAVHSAYYRAAGEQERADNEARTANAAIDRARVAKVRGEPGADVEAAITAARKAGERADEVRADFNAAHHARGEVEEELNGLLADNFALFGEAAVVKSETAEDALRKVLSGMLRAEHLWREAQEAWKPLARAKSIAGVPPFPLVRASPIAARPPSVQVDEAA